ncbi:hypothetical protein LCGC14_3088750 [marine sediment metagenome]|uniref:Uncharacterized protein n=1 Tax=marine sediment metagenome TaxID=412755 RepID=A0A0F8YIP0_9ZZZZ
MDTRIKVIATQGFFIGDGMKKHLDLTGKKFGRLTVLEDSKKRQFGKIIWDCLCYCGGIKAILSSNLTTGNTKSCGCLNREVTKNRSLKHGSSGKKDRTYECWEEAEEGHKKILKKQEEETP